MTGEVNWSTSKYGRFLWVRGKNGPPIRASGFGGGAQVRWSVGAPWVRRANVCGDDAATMHNAPG